MVGDAIVKVKQVGLDAIESRIERAMRNGRDMSPLMRDISDIMMRSTEANFAAQGRPAWQDLAPATKRARKRTGHWPGQILQVTGQLSASVHDFFTATTAGVGTNKVYALIQQLGGTVEHAARQHTLYFRADENTGEIGNRFVKRKRSNFSQEVTIAAHKVEIPARPFLQMTEVELRQIEAAAAAFMTG